MQPHENVSEQLPKSPEEERILAVAVTKLLETVPEIWTEFSYDELTATEQRALFLLLSSGMIEQRMRFRIRPLNSTGGLEAVIGATGEYGLVEALDNLIPRLWEEWQKVWREWEAGGQIGSSPFHCERLTPERWRLTDRGVLAVGNLKQKKPDVVLDSVFRRKSFRGQPGFRGSGELLSLQDLSGETAAPKTVQVGNWNEGAEAFAAFFAQSFVAAMVRAQKDDQPEEMGQGGRAGESPPTPSASEPQESDAHPELKPFSGGTMVFFRDRVELCGVDICSGPRSTTKRRILDCLRKKQSNGNFIGYSSQKLAKAAGLYGGQNAAAGVIRDLRDDIVESLRTLANLNCGRFDVILSRGPGYRLADCLSVQDGDDLEATEIRDIDDTIAVPNVPNDDARDVPNVPDHNVPNVPDDAVGKRRAWILQQLVEGHELQAPALAKQFKCSTKTAKRDLQALKKEGLIEFVGATRTGFYRLRKPLESDE